MIQILESLERCFKIAMISMLKALMEKIGNMKDQIGNFIGEMEAIRKKLNWNDKKFLKTST